MQKTHVILRAGQLVNPNIFSSVISFEQKTGKNLNEIMGVVKTQGGLPLEMYSNEELEQIKKNGTIYLYKTGQLDEKKFIKAVNTFLESNLSEEEFKECWNEMCNINESDLKKIKELEQVQKEKNVAIHVLSCSNKLHTEHVKNQLKQNGVNLNINWVTSFENQTLELSKLKEKAIKTIDKKDNIKDFSEKDIKLKEIIDIVNPAEMMTLFEKEIKKQEYKEQKSKLKV